MFKGKAIIAGYPIIVSNPKEPFVVEFYFKNVVGWETFFNRKKLIDKILGLSNTR
jgi:hypothetical protein